MNKKLLKTLSLSYLIALALLMLIPVGNTSVKLNDVMVVSLRGDYLVHAMVSMPWMWVGRFVWHEKLKGVWWFLFGVALMMALELVQMWLPYRTFNINDLVAGVIGVFLSLGSVAVWTKIKRRYTKTTFL